MSNFVYVLQVGLSGMEKEIGGVFEDMGEVLEVLWTTYPALRGEMYTLRNDLNKWTISIDGDLKAVITKCEFGLSLISE